MTGIPSRVVLAALEEARVKFGHIDPDDKAKVEQVAVWVRRRVREVMGLHPPLQVVDVKARAAGDE